MHLFQRWKHLKFTLFFLINYVVHKLWILRFIKLKDACTSNLEIHQVFFYVLTKSIGESESKNLSSICFFKCWLSQSLKLNRKSQHLQSEKHLTQSQVKQLKLETVIREYIAGIQEKWNIILIKLNELIIFRREIYIILKIGGMIDWNRIDVEANQQKKKTHVVQICCKGDKIKLHFVDIWKCLQLMKKSKAATTTKLGLAIDRIRRIQI